LPAVEVEVEVGGVTGVVAPVAGGLLLPVVPTAVGATGLAVEVGSADAGGTATGAPESTTAGVGVAAAVVTVAAVGLWALALAELCPAALALPVSGRVATARAAPAAMTRRMAPTPMETVLVRPADFVEDLDESATGTVEAAADNEELAPEPGPEVPLALSNAPTRLGYTPVGPAPPPASSVIERRAAACRACA
jgi:hypothetical protein